MIKVNTVSCVNCLLSSFSIASDRNTSPVHPNHLRSPSVDSLRYLPSFPPTDWPNRPAAWCVGSMAPRRPYSDTIRCPSGLSPRRRRLVQTVRALAGVARRHRRRRRRFRSPTCRWPCCLFVRLRCCFGRMWRNWPVGTSLGSCWHPLSHCLLRWSRLCDPFCRLLGRFLHLRNWRAQAFSFSLVGRRRHRRRCHPQGLGLPERRTSSWARSLAADCASGTSNRRRQLLMPSRPMSAASCSFLNPWRISHW